MTIFHMYKEIKKVLSSMEELTDYSAVELQKLLRDNNIIITTSTIQDIADILIEENYLTINYKGLYMKVNRGV